MKKTNQLLVWSRSENNYCVPAQTEYTPGPWIVDDRHVHRKHGLTYPNGQEPETDLIVLVDADCHDNGLLNQTDKANLRLIAASPDLLTACQFAIETLESAKEYPGIVSELRKAVEKAVAQPQPPTP